MTYLILFLCISIVGFFYFKPWIYMAAEDRRILIQTEIRLRKSGRTKDTPLSHYQLDDLLMIEKNLREIKSKRKMGYRLLPEEQSLIHRFPFSYHIIRKSSRKEKQKAA